MDGIKGKIAVAIGIIDFIFPLKYKLGCNILYYSLTDIVRLKGVSPR